MKIQISLTEKEINQAIYQYLINRYLITNDFRVIKFYQALGDIILSDIEGEELL